MDAKQNRIQEYRRQGKTAAEIGALEKMSADQVKRSAGWAAGFVAPVRAYKIGGSPHDREIIKLQEENKRLKKELQTAHTKALDDEAVREIIGSLTNEPVDPPTWLVKIASKAMKTPEVPVTSWADWHAAEVVFKDQLNGVNEYNPKIMDARVRRLVERTINLAREHGPGVYPGIVVNLIGDMVSGMLHPELVKTDSEGVLPACMRVRDLLVWALSAMADEFGQVYAPAVCGNHGRKTHRPEFKNYAYENFDWLIYQMVIAAFKDRKDDRIKIDCRPANEVSYRVFNMRFLTMHGDMMGVKGGDGIIGAIGPIMRGEVKVRGWADSAGVPYDHAEIGHWHQELFLPRLTVSNTLKGYCEFAKNALRAPISEPSQPLKFIHPRYGITSRWSIKVNPYSEAEKAPWVAVFDPGKAA